MVLLNILRKRRQSCSFLTKFKWFKNCFFKRCLATIIQGIPIFLGVIGQSSASRRWSRFVNYSNDRIFDGLTTFVHNSINRFSRRNTYKPPQPQYTRRTDLDYDYYAYEDDQNYAENQYFRK